MQATPSKAVPEVLMHVQESPFSKISTVTGAGAEGVSASQVSTAGELDQRLRENEESILHANLEDEKPNGGDSDEEGVESSLDIFTDGMLNAVQDIDQEENNVLTFDRDFLDAPENCPPLDLLTIGNRNRKPNLGNLHFVKLIILDNGIILYSSLRSEKQTRTINMFFILFQLGAHLFEEIIKEEGCPKDGNSITAGGRTQVELSTGMVQQGTTYFQQEEKEL